MGCGGLRLLVLVLHGVGLARFEVRSDGDGDGAVEERCVRRVMRFDSPLAASPSSSCPCSTRLLFPLPVVPSGLSAPAECAVCRRTPALSAPAKATDSSSNCSKCFCCKNSLVDNLGAESSESQWGGLNVGQDTGSR